MKNTTFKNLSQSIPKKYLTELMNSTERVRVFDPLKTLQLFLYQIMHQASCRTALSIYHLTNSISSLNSGAYTRAKKRLPEDVLKNIALSTGENKEEKLWKNRVVKFVDGTTMQMEDTKENQKSYPQNIRQKKGLGQPILRMLTVFSYSTGRICDVELASYSGKGTGEPSLLRRILDRFSKDDILVMDRFYTGMCLELKKAQIDYLIRGRDKSLQKYFKANRKQVYLENGIRLIKHVSKIKGYRDKVYYFMTSLTKEYTCKDLAELYETRWSAELGLRNIKRTMGSYFLKSKSPGMVRKELYVYILGHNLTHCLMNKGVNKKRSFKLALNLIKKLQEEKTLPKVYETASEILIKIQWSSKFRSEPRMLKKRYKATYSYLMKPRQVMKAQYAVA
jgi:hypothetical protein